MIANDENRKCIQSYYDMRIHADRDKRERSRVELNAKRRLKRAARVDVTWVYISLKRLVSIEKIANVNTGHT
jgi:hypothetical protein